MTKERKNLLVFGYGVVLIALFFAWRLYAKHGWGYGSTIATSIAGIFLCMTLCSLPLLKKVYDRWMQVAHLISLILTTIILTLLFILVFGIAGIVLRLLKKDLLEMRARPGIKTYWKLKNNVYVKENYLRQF